MPTAIITAAYVNPPKGTARSGNVKTPEGDYYTIPRTMLSQFSAGSKYEVEYEERQGTGQWSDRVFKDVTRILQSRAPAPGAAAAGGAYRETSNKDAERMFVTAMMRSYVQAGVLTTPNSDEVIRAIRSLRVAWNETFGTAAPRAAAPAPAPRPRGDMDDEIPF